MVKKNNGELTAAVYRYNLIISSPDFSIQIAPSILCVHYRWQLHHVLLHSSSLCGLANRYTARKCHMSFHCSSSMLYHVTSCRCGVAETTVHNRSTNYHRPDQPLYRFFFMTEGIQIGPSLYQPKYRRACI